MARPRTSKKAVSDGGRYQPVCELAAGGMGRVDLVVRRDGSFLRFFARKRLRPELVDDDAVRRMFLDEGRIAGLVRHPHVVSVVDVGEDAAGPYLVMDFVEGISLAQLVARVAARRQQVPLAVALRIAGQVAEGLHAVHETCGPDGEPLQLIHRDVSPQNVLIAFDGTARVSDFGIAKALGRRTRTTTGVLKGKLGYLAPERLRFEEPDRRADLFSFGVVLFELLAARRLYDSPDEVQGARRILDEPPPDITDERDDVDPELVELLFELLAKDPACRPPDAGVLARRLERIGGSLAVTHEGGDVGAYVTGLFQDERAALRAKVIRASSQASSPGLAATFKHGSRARMGWAAAASLAAVALATVCAGKARHVTAGPRSQPSQVAASSDARAMPAPLAVPAMPATRSSEIGHRAPKRRARTGRAPSPRPGQPSGDCAPPYTVNAAGERQFELRCLIDVRN